MRVQQEKLRSVSEDDFTLHWLRLMADFVRHVQKDVPVRQAQGRLSGAKQLAEKLWAGRESNTSGAKALIRRTGLRPD